RKQQQHRSNSSHDSPRLLNSEPKQPLSRFPTSRTSEHAVAISARHGRYKAVTVHEPNTSRRRWFGLTIRADLADRCATADMAEHLLPAYTWADMSDQRIGCAHLGGEKTR